MRLFHKLLIGPTTAILFLLLFGAVTISAMWAEKEALVDIYENLISHYSASTYSAGRISSVHSGVYRLVILASGYNKELVDAMAQEQKAYVNEILTDLSELFKSSREIEEKRLLEVVINNLSDYKTQVSESIDLSISDRKKGVDSMAKTDNVYDTLMSNFTALIDYETSQAKQSYDGAVATFNRSLLIAVIVLAIACVMSILISTLMGRKILNPLTQAVKIARQVASGDLTSRVEVKSSDETGQLSQSLKEMNNSLVSIVTEVRNSANSIAVAAAEIAVGNDELSQRTSEQASSLEETAASLEELTATVMQNAEHTKQANHLASNASEVAVKGGEIVGEAVATMDTITESSKKIVEIISVIEGISYQTNLLALNAAVEAARAGEQGRGFAVVASEVRNLAKRSADAAKQIKVLIDDSVSKVQTGSTLVNNAGKTMDEIVSSIKKVSNLIAEIAAASNEQSSGIAQVNTAVTQMDGVTQQNAAMVEEASAAASALEEQARKLNEAVNVFKLSGSEQISQITQETRIRATSEPRVQNVRSVVDISEQTAPVEQSTRAEPAKKRVLKVVDANSNWNEF
jgi:methyl-accepting chemotaxis protein